jgi:hypothetical protein
MAGSAALATAIDSVTIKHVSGIKSTLLVQIPLSWALACLAGRNAARRVVRRGTAVRHLMEGLTRTNATVLGWDRDGDVHAL